MRKGHGAQIRGRAVRIEGDRRRRGEPAEIRGHSSGRHFPAADARNDGGVPAAVSPELAALEVDPFIVGDVREGDAPFIHNGETAVFVRTHSDDEVDLAVATIRLYAPIKIKVVASGEGAPLSHDIL